MYEAPHLNYIDYWKPNGCICFLKRFKHTFIILIHIIFICFLKFSFQAKVVDGNGIMVPFGTPGELLIRGYVNMNGYFNDEQKTKETIDSNRWLHTG